ncbi:MAG: HpcH/HpaI aldolase family protein [Rhizobiaceae bacterium]
MIFRLATPLGEDRTVSVVWCAMRDPQLVATIARQNFGAVLLDAQHGFHDEVSFQNCIPIVVTAGKSPLVRIPVGRWDLCERVLDFGALGVVAPMINCREDAVAFANAAKYPGTGTRSYGPRHAATLYDMTSDEYVTQSNDCTKAFAQIETRQAYENLDEILSVDGIDGILMGPSDFSISVTGNQTPDAYGKETVDLVANIAERTRAAGKVAAAFTLSTEHSNLVHSMGYRLISITMDGSIIAAGSEKAFKNLDF